MNFLKSWLNIFINGLKYVLVVDITIFVSCIIGILLVICISKLIEKMKRKRK